MFRTFCIAGVVAAVVALAAVTADDSPGQPQMLFREQPPEPVPYGFKRCIRFVFTPEKAKELGRVQSTFRPPITDKEISAINRSVQRGWGHVYYCSSSDA